jgi:CRP-like cAMP-binding protein/tetratricopeptide (TPR) repeat protein
MAKDVRQLREDAAIATSGGKHKRALELYAELERIESADAQWPKRIAETYRKLGKSSDAVSAYERAADRYANNGFLVQAIAVCKLILQLEPKHQGTLRRLSEMNAAHTTGQTRIGTLSANNPALHENPSVAMLRGAQGTGGFPVAPMPPAVPAVPTVSRTRSKPITMAPGAALDGMALRDIVDGSRAMNDDGSSPGITLIPLDDSEAFGHEDSQVAVSVSTGELDVDLDEDDLEEAEELDLADIEDINDIPLPEPKRVSGSARRALAATPLFAAMEPAAIETMIAQLELVPLPANDVVFTEGDPGDALYIVAEGEVSVCTEGPPRVEIQRLKAGAFFGEVALVTDTPRTATVTTVMATELLKINRATLAVLLESHPDVLRALLRFVRERLVERWTRTSPIFRPFNSSERNALVARFRFLEIEGGSRIVAAKAKPDGLYILLAGRAEIARGDGTVIAIGPGELIGEGALLSGGKLDYEVRATGKCLALCLPAAEFREIIMTHPHVLEYIGDHAEQRRKLEMT